MDKLRMNSQEYSSDVQVLVPKFILRKAVLDFSAEHEEGPSEEEFDLVRRTY